MEMDYPNNPTYGQFFTSGGFTWMWDGQKWASGLGAPVTSVAGRTGDVVLTHSDITDWAAATPFLPLAGGTITGNLNVNGSLGIGVNLDVNGSIYTNSTISTPQTITGGAVAASGSNAALIFYGRDTGQTWEWYAQSGSARLFYGGYGDLVSIDTGGNLNAVGQITTNSNVIGNNSVQSNGVYFQNSGGAFYSPQSIYSGSEVRAAGATWTGGIYWQNNGGWMYTPWSLQTNGNFQCNASVTANGDVHVGSYLYLSTGTLYNPGDGWGYFNGSFRCWDFQSSNNVNAAGELIFGGLTWSNNGGWVYTGSGVWCANINTGPIQLNGNNINGGATYYANGSAYGGWGIQFGWINGNWYAFAPTDAIYFYTNQGYVGGTYYDFCDERMKWNFKSVTRDCLTAINAIELKGFDFSEGPPQQRKVNPYETRPEYFIWEDLPRKVKHIETGFIAQQLREIIPEAVPDPPEEGAYLSVDMRPLVATLIGAVQQLTERLKVLEGR